MAGRWFSPGTLVSSTNTSDYHHMTEILFNVTLNTITLTLMDKDASRTICISALWLMTVISLIQYENRKYQPVYEGNHIISVVVIFLIPPFKYQQRKECFFYRTISDWNRPSQAIVVSGSVKSFKAAVSSITYLLMKHVNSLNLL